QVGTGGHIEEMNQEAALVQVAGEGDVAGIGDPVRVRRAGVRVDGQAAGRRGQGQVHEDIEETVGGDVATLVTRPDADCLLPRGPIRRPTESPSGDRCIAQVGIGSYIEQMNQEAALVQVAGESDATGIGNAVRGRRAGVRVDGQVGGRRGQGQVYEDVE